MIFGWRRAAVIEYKETGDDGSGILSASVQSHSLEEAYYINMGKSHYPDSK